VGRVTALFVTKEDLTGSNAGENPALRVKHLRKEMMKANLLTLDGK
jgi:hypothetical protein